MFRQTLENNQNKECREKGFLHPKWPNFKNSFMRYISFFLLVFLFGCGQDNETENPTISDSPNILLIVADDLGRDAINGYSEGSEKPTTPNIDAIRADGLTFNNLWVNPTCSPTRSSIITGKYGYRTSVKWANDELDQSEIILQRYIKEETQDKYATAVIGKWHLSGDQSDINPEEFGMDYYSGLTRGAVQSYYQWQLTEDGTVEQQTEYITTVFTDLSINWINEQSKPWFLWLAYNAPHTPFHVPPGEMHSQGNLPNYASGLDPEPYYMAAIEAMDYQIGRLLSEIPKEELDNTVIIFIGDNGSPNQVAQAPFSFTKAKGSLYQGGINVPMFVAGKDVSRSGEENSLLCGTDLFSTIAELAEVDIAEIHDSKSFKSLLSGGLSSRDFQYSEMNNGTDDLWAISNGQYKLIISANGNEEMYDLADDPYEENNLLDGALSTAEKNVKGELEEELSKIRD